MIIKTNNAKCREHVQARRPFQGSNLYGRNVGPGFVVYSYGEHFPLFIHDGAKWYANSDRYSVTTSKHFGQAHPHEEAEPRNTQELYRIAEELYFRGKDAVWRVQIGPDWETVGQYERYTDGSQTFDAWRDASRIGEGRAAGQGVQLVKVHPSTGHAETWREHSPEGDKAARRLLQEAAR